MKLFSPAISKLIRLRYSGIEEWMNNPLAAQREILQDLFTHGQHTAFGRQYNFKNMFTIKAFKENVPVHEYEDIKPWIEKLMSGEQNQLWDSPVSWFAKSSGTTSEKSKFIPVTKESLEDCHYQAGKDVLTLYYHFNPESHLLTGKGLVIGGSHQISQLNEEIFFGDLSAVLMQNMPMWGHWIRTPELAIALLDEWETKIESLAQSTIPENVTSISGVPTWTQVLINRILQITGKSNLKQVWPNLELYMHGGVSFLPYKENFKKLIGGDVHYMEMYNASEGFFAAQDDLNKDGMLLFLNHGIFYEFMPIEEYGKTNPQTIGLAEVKTGNQYAPVISTNSGLWRYLVGDTIQFTSINPFRIKVTGRLKHFINAFGEEIIVDNTDAAIAAASEKTGAVVNDYTAAPIYFTEHNNGAHEWLIEFEKDPPDMEQFIYELDSLLKNINSDYEAKRYKNIALRMPIVHSLKKGIFNSWLKQKGKLGGQHKVPRLSNDRKFIEELHSIINIS
jgi:hypothetical protein